MSYINAPTKNVWRNSFNRGKYSRYPAKRARPCCGSGSSAETDIEVGTLQSGWKHYAEWMEKLSAKKINNGLVRENEMLRNRMQEAMNILESGISGQCSIKK